MCESNCCCGYQSPPWWVTMGFTPPNHPAATTMGSPPATPATPATPGIPGVPGTQTQGGSNPLTGIVDTIGSVLGGLGSFL